MTPFSGPDVVSNKVPIVSPKALAQRILVHRIQIAVIFAICDRDAQRGPKKSLRFWRQDTAMLHCDLGMR